MMAESYMTVDEHESDIAVIEEDAGGLDAPCRNMAEVG